MGGVGFQLIIAGGGCVWGNLLRFTAGVVRGSAFSEKLGGSWEGYGWCLRGVKKTPKTPPESRLPI